MIIQAVPQDAIKQVLKLPEESYVSLFLMNLCPEFEAVRASIMNREPTPDLETCVQEVLREELPLQSPNKTDTRREYDQSDLLYHFHCHN